MKCTVCDKEFDSTRNDAKYCSDACRKKDKRSENVRDNQENVRDNIKSDKSDATDNYYESKEYKDLIKHLEETPIEKLKEEGIFIPAWKYAGFKRKPTPKEIIAVAGGMDIKDL